jgi:2-oxo-4-hydroxy-4-carboxy-5-ureidoimidazoline decarboxylase
MTGLAWLNALPAEEAERALLACLAAPRWAAGLAAARPYGSRQALAEMAATLVAGLDWAEVEQALAAHPRIGDRPRGDGRESAWSRGEQAGVTTAADELREANLAYEQRFDRVFLICATGKSGPEILAALRARLDNDEETERQVVRAELGKIADLRLTKLLELERA